MVCMRDVTAAIKTERLTLRALTPGEMDAAFEAIPPNIPRERRAVYADKRALMEAHPEEWLFCTIWLMELAGTDTAVGELGFKGPPADGALEIGYGVEPRYRNRGYMKEAVAALCGYGLSHPGVTAITAQTEPENYASQNVLAACGFEKLDREGRMLRFRLTQDI